MQNNDETFIVEGLAGKRTLTGEIKIGGAKNAALKAMAASVLFEGPLSLHNIPDTEDIHKMVDLMRLLGISVSEIKEASLHSLDIEVPRTTSTDLDHTIAKSMRGSVVITGPLLARFGNVSFPAPGGCVIGARPIDLFIEGYKKMGATVEIKDAESNLARYEISAPEGGLRGAEIIFPIQTVGGTETLMMTAVLARGKTLLKNCALEPEIISLAEFLNVSGADIRGIGTPTLEIHGKGSAKTAHLLRQKPNTPYVTIPDRIEAGSFLFLAALSARDLKITHCDPSHLDVPLSILRDAGVLLEIGKNYIRITSQMILDKNQNPLDLKPSHIRTHEYPGFPTDIQAPAAVFLTQTIGESIIFETIFEGRFKYVDELNRMGASITTMNPREIVIKGKTVLRALDPGESLVAHDIRAGFAVIMAALLAEGTSVIRGTYLIDRGYERIEERLRAIGAHIQRIQN